MRSSSFRSKLQTDDVARVEARTVDMMAAQNRLLQEENDHLDQQIKCYDFCEEGAKPKASAIPERIRQSC